MWRFYGRMLLGVPKSLWEASDRWSRIVQLALVAGILIPGLSDISRGTLTANLYWITLGSFLALLLFVLACANYEKFLAERGRADAIERRATQTEGELADHVRQQEQTRVQIQLGEPKMYEGEELQTSHLVHAGPHTSVSSGPLHPVFKEGLRVTLWRIPIQNTGAPAPEVRVKLIKVEGGPLADPLQALVPVTLHRRDDNPPDKESYRESFSLGKEEPVEIDLISMEERPPARCFLYKTGSRDHVQELSVPDNAACTFVIAVFAGDYSIEREYWVEANVSEQRLNVYA